MNLTTNMLFQWQDGSASPRTERVLWIEQSGSRIVTIDIQDKKAGRATLTGEIGGD